VADSFKDLSKYYEAANEPAISETSERRREEVCRRITARRQQALPGNDP
jgi:hypothetical protein